MSSITVIAGICAFFLLSAYFSAKFSIVTFSQKSLYLNDFSKCVYYFFQDFLFTSFSVNWKHFSQMYIIAITRLKLMKNCGPCTFPTSVTSFTYINNGESLYIECGKYFWYIFLSSLLSLNLLVWFSSTYTNTCSYKFVDNYFEEFYAKLILLRNCFCCLYVNFALEISQAKHVQLNVE